MVSETRICLAAQTGLTFRRRFSFASDIELSRNGRGNVLSSTLIKGLKHRDGGNMPTQMFLATTCCRHCARPVLEFRKRVLYVFTVCENEVGCAVLGQGQLSWRSYRSFGLWLWY